VLYPNVDKLMVNGKNISVKFPTKTEFFKTKTPGTPFPRFLKLHVEEPAQTLLCIRKL
jgi:hypothetical protein